MELLTSPRASRASPGAAGTVALRAPSPTRTRLFLVLENKAQRLGSGLREETNKPARARVMRNG
jgi:hypothetical protein